MEHDPLGYSDYTVLGFAQRRELGKNGVVGVGHDGDVMEMLRRSVVKWFVSRLGVWAVSGREWRSQTAVESKE